MIFWDFFKEIVIVILNGVCWKNWGFWSFVLSGLGFVEGEESVGVCEVVFDLCSCWNGRCLIMEGEESVLDVIYEDEDGFEIMEDVDMVDVEEGEIVVVYGGMDGDKDKDGILGKEDG